MHREWSRPEPPWQGRRGKGHHGGPVVAAFLFHVIGAMTQTDEPGGPVLTVPTVALLVAGPIALAWRRKAPIVVLAVAAAASVAFCTQAEPHWMYVVAPVIALFNAVKMGRSAPAFGVAAAAYAGYVLICSVFADRFGIAETARPAVRDLLLLGATLLVTMLLGRAAKAQAEHLAEMTKVRAERAKAKEEQERRQASEERLRMARELHDVLGHHLSLINVQAGVGLHLMDNRPEQAREALTAIKTASSEALREVRAVLGVLRPEEEAAPRQPALGLDRLEELTADAGLPVRTTTSGERRPLPAEVDRAAYRIVQEALTNIRKHAPAEAKAEVEVDYAPEELRLSIRNDGPPLPEQPEGPPARNDGTPAEQREGLRRLIRSDGPSPAEQPDEPEPTEGSGITGMRARAEALGGRLQAGPLPAGGFLVTAVLPTKGGEA